MNDKHPIKETIDLFRQEGGEDFICNEEAIIDEFNDIIANTGKESLATKILSVLGGILSSLALLGFLMLSFLNNSGTGMLVFGAIMIITSIVISRTVQKRIIDTISISFYAIGFFLIAFGSFDVGINSDWVCLAFIIVSLITISTGNNYLLTFISVFIINGTIRFYIYYNNYNLVFLLMFGILQIAFLSYWYLYEGKIITYSTKSSELYNPVRSGMTFSVLGTLTIFYPYQSMFEYPIMTIIFAIAIVAILFYLIHKLTGILKIEAGKTKTAIYAASAFIFLLASFAPAISCSLLVMLLCFYTNYKTGFVVGILSFIYSVAAYYYNLDISLLAKSGILFSTGILFLVFFLFTHKRNITDEKI